MYNQNTYPTVALYTNQSAIFHYMLGHSNHTKINFYTINTANNTKAICAHQQYNPIVYENNFFYTLN